MPKSRQRKKKPHPNAGSFKNPDPVKLYADKRIRDLETVKEMVEIISGKTSHENRD